MAVQLSPVALTRVEQVVVASRLRWNPPGWAATGSGSAVPADCLAPGAAPAWTRWAALAVTAWSCPAYLSPSGAAGWPAWACWEVSAGGGGSILMIANPGHSAGGWAGNRKILRDACYPFSFPYCYSSFTTRDSTHYMESGASSEAMTRRYASMKSSSRPSSTALTLPVS
jgi:hypothetical protein